MHMNKDQRSWLWPALLAATIFTLSGATRIAVPDIGLQFSKDKIAHFRAAGYGTVTDPPPQPQRLARGRRSGKHHNLFRRLR